MMISYYHLLSSVLLATTAAAFSIVSPYMKNSQLISHRLLSPVTSLCAQPGQFEYALIFDCDGVIIETEELHRLAYNAAFKAADLQIDGEPVE